VATASANTAADAGINIFVVTLDQAEAGSPCLSADVAFNESLARGYGGAVATTDDQKLDDFLVSILKRMPFHLVR
jgi:predicted outer membrane repeat protein